MRAYRYFFFLGIFFLFSFFFHACTKNINDGRVYKATQYTSAARHRTTSQPYVVYGTWYTPTVVKKGYKQYGISSWYGPKFNGKYTSNGEIYDMYANTAAHKTWPMDTIVRVDNLDNGKSTVVRINDRGPFVDHRIIDCSYQSGKELGLNLSGLANVELTVLGTAEKKENLIISNEYNNSSQQKMPKRVKASDSNSSQLGIQLGAYSKLGGAIACARTYNHGYTGYTSMIKKTVDAQGAVLYRVWLIGFKTKDEFNQFIEKQYLSEDGI